MSNQNVRSLFAMLRSNAAARYALAPASVGDGTGAITLTVAAGPTWSAYSDLAAVNAITTEFWLVGLAYTTATVACLFQLQVSDATPTVKMEFTFDPTIGTSNLGADMVPIPLYMPANSQVQARVGGTDEKTINIQLIYAVGF